MSAATASTTGPPGLGSNAFLILQRVGRSLMTPIAVLPAAAILLLVRVVPGRPVPANSMLSVLTLDAKGGQAVVLSAEGEGADDALDALAELLASDPDNED
jgi:phosphocarrier protein HPr